ncbi:hypothetical protein ACTXT7_002020 [Hymenolepis weldensis]
MELWCLDSEREMLNQHDPQLNIRSTCIGGVAYSSYNDHIAYFGHLRHRQPTPADYSPPVTFGFKVDRELFNDVQICYVKERKFDIYYGVSIE